ncbi:3-oxoacyl-[acyl-carrier-protein] synthase [Tulasnella sp. 424]|nr:3-oxoacyl-[acyl-carrier-protein] synthase [Tulasnella sp. 424]
MHVASPFEEKPKALRSLYLTAAVVIPTSDYFDSLSTDNLKAIKLRDQTLKTSRSPPVLDVHLDIWFKKSEARLTSLPNKRKEALGKPPVCKNVTAKGDIVSTKAVKKGLRKLEAYVQEMAKGDAVPTVNIQMVQDDAVKLWTLVNGSHHCQGTGVPVLMSAQTTLEMAAAIRGIVAFTSAPTDHAGRSPSRDINYRAANARSNERNLLKEEVELRAKLGQPLKLTSASAPLPLNRRLHARRKSY